MYQCFSSYRSHVYRFHNNTEAVQLANDQCAVSGGSEVDEPLQDNSNYEGIFQDHDINSDPDGNDLTKALGTFYLTLEAKHLVPSSTVQTIVSGINDLARLSMSHQEKKLRSLLQGTLTEETIDSVADQLFNESKSSNVFLNQKFLSSVHLRKKYYHEEYTFVEPVKTFFDDDPDAQPRKFYYYVPIKETITAMYSDPAFRVAAHTVPVYDSTRLTDYHDGTRYQRYRHLLGESESLNIILFQDAFGLVNPLLPSTAKKHKLLGVYMVLGNTPAHWRSHVNNIQLVGLCKEKEYEHTKFYKKTHPRFEGH